MEKLKSSDKQIFNLKDGYYGIVSKRNENEVNDKVTEFKDHHSVGVLVKIID